MASVLAKPFHPFLQWERHVVAIVDGGMVPLALVGAAETPIVCLHGWTLDHRVWIPQLDLARRGQALIAPDRRGFGMSSAPPALAQERDDIGHILRGQHSNRCILLGLSQGAAVALDFARSCPHLVAALILIGAPPHGLVAGDDDGDIPRAVYADLVRTGRIAQMKALWHRHPLTAVSAKGQALLDSMLHDYDGRDQLVDQAPLHFIPADIAALPMPVLAMAGASDVPARRATALMIGETASRGQSLIIPNAGHIANIDNPTVVNDAITDFLSTLPPTLETQP